jgi:hypothetical protein
MAPHVMTHLHSMCSARSREHRQSAAYFIEKLDRVNREQLNLLKNASAILSNYSSFNS